MDSVTLHYAFGDESGTVGREKGTAFFLVAVASVEQPRVLQLPIQRALKKYGRLSHGELKASNIEKPATMRILSEIAKQDVHIAAVIVDQKIIVQQPEDDEEIYRRATARAIRHLVKEFSAIDVIGIRQLTHKTALKIAIFHTKTLLPITSNTYCAGSSLHKDALTR